MNPDTLPELPFEPERYELSAPLRYQFNSNRREFLKVVGGGIVVCLVWNDASAFQQAGRGRRRGGGGDRPTELGAWLHIDETGSVTAYTGKVEVGQNIRTSLSQAVADELRCSISSIEMVMADTDLTPFDGGTSGSRTTPAMAPQLRRVAATAREMLLDLAKDAMQVDRTMLTVADGKVTESKAGRSLTFGELTKGQRLTKTLQTDVSVMPAAEWKVAGNSAPKVDAAAIVTGKHQYASDIKRSGMLFGKVLRPPTLKATLVSVDLKEAEGLPDVTVVHDKDQQFVGVVAPDSHRAEQALAAIKAEWNSPPQSSAKTLFRDLKENRGGGQQGGRGGNQSVGSIEAGIAAADFKVQGEYTIAYIAHAPLEPRAAVAEWNEGKLTVWTGTQRPFGVRGDLANAFGLSQEQVRVIVPDTGSGYGGKHRVETAMEAARLAKAVGKPVKLVWTREEEFTWAYFRPAGVIEVTAGVRKDSTLTAWEFHNYNSGGSSLQPLYAIPNQRVQFHDAKSPLAQGSYRALASTANHFARESHIDDLAHGVQVEPLTFRLNNLKDARLTAVLEAAGRQFGWGTKKLPSGHGVGIAGGSEKGSYVATCAEVSVDRSSGSVRIIRLTTAFECGAIVNPEHLKNQVEGAVVMGLGGALFEEIDFEDGKILNARFSDYRVPRFSDVPVLETVLIDRKDLPSAGSGETPIVAVAPAIGNAIFQATGVRLRSLPMVPKGLKS